MAERTTCVEIRANEIVFGGMYVLTGSHSSNSLKRQPTLMNGSERNKKNGQPAATDICAICQECVSLYNLSFVFSPLRLDQNNAKYSKWFHEQIINSRVESAWYICRLGLFPLIFFCFEFFNGGPAKRKCIRNEKIWVTKKKNFVNIFLRRLVLLICNFSIDFIVTCHFNCMLSTYLLARF